MASTSNNLSRNLRVPKKVKHFYCGNTRPGHKLSLCKLVTGSEDSAQVQIELSIEQENLISIKLQPSRIVCGDTLLQMGAICKMTTSTNATDEYNGMKTIEGARCLVEPWSYHHNSVLLPAPPNPINTLNCLSEIFNLYLPITFIVPAYTPRLGQ